VNPSTKWDIKKTSFSMRNWSWPGLLVDLITHYSNTFDQVERLRRLDSKASTDDEPDLPATPLAAVRSKSRPARPRVRDRLTPEDVAALVDGFQSGVTQKRLAVQYGISLSTVKRLIRAAPSTAM
jgi:hypothetical protein